MSSTQTTQFRSYEETVRDVMSRYSVADLVQQTDADLERGDELFYKAKQDMRLATNGKMGQIFLWTVFSGDRGYQVRRFKNFVWCECRDFFFRRKVCKHIAMTTGILCAKCGELRAVVGKLCHECDYHTNGLCGGNS